MGSFSLETILFLFFRGGGGADCFPTNDSAVVQAS